jgi:hypothetical protein
MANTKGQEVIDFFESSFADKQVLPDSLEMIWLRKAIGRYSLELDQLNYDEEIMSFDKKLDDYVITTLASFMKQMYQERQYSLVNKRVSIVGKDLSIDGSGSQKVHTKNELDYSEYQSSEIVEHQKPSAYV